MSSRGTPSPVASPSRFQGKSLADILASSSYGRFINAIGSVSAEINDPALNLSRFELPQVVVIGSESNGKSSLLENITKCPVFPRTKNIGTKRPVIFRLCNGLERSFTIKCGQGPEQSVQAQDILGIVQSFMDKVPKNKFEDEEIEIKITDPGLPTFTFADLPGIRNVPEAMKRETRRLAEKYLRMPHNLIVLVEAATTNRLNSSSAVELVLEHHKEAQTILVLTMVDKVVADDVRSHLIDRLLGNSDELCDTKFHGYAAVINRKETDPTPPDEAESREERLLKGILRSHAHQSEYQRLSGMMGIGNLLLIIDAMYQEYITKHWKPVALKRLSELQGETKAKEDILGTVPSALSLIQVLQEISRQLMGKFISDANSGLPKFTDPPHELTYYWGSRQWASAAKSFSSEVRSISEAWAKSRPYEEELRAIVATAFNSTLPLRLERFEYLKAALNQSIAASYTTFFRALLPDIHDIINRSALGVFSGQFDRTHVARQLAGMVLSNVVLPVIEDVAMASMAGLRTGNTAALLEETPSFADQRRSLVNRFSVLNKARVIIENIDEKV